MGSKFFERYADLCKSKGGTPNSVAKEIGASSGSVTAWKNGTEPRGKTLGKIADYFGVTTDYLLGKEEKAPAATGECKYDASEILFALSRGGEKEITLEMFEEVKRFAAYVAQRETNK